MKASSVGFGTWALLPSPYLGRRGPPPGGEQEGTGQREVSVASCGNCWYCLHPWLHGPALPAFHLPGRPQQRVRPNGAKEPIPTPSTEGLLSPVSVSGLAQVSPTCIAFLGTAADELERRGCPGCGLQVSDTA